MVVLTIRRLPQGIPTTRALCCITSDSRVERDVLYTGNPILERCSVVCRLAPTFWRFGTFQICSTTNALTGTQRRPCVHGCVVALV